MNGQKVEKSDPMTVFSFYIRHAILGNQVTFYANDFSLILDDLLADKITCNATSIDMLDICIF